MRTENKKYSKEFVEKNKNYILKNMIINILVV